MTTLENPKSNKPATKFDWTKIHLVYLALAGFDLLAIGAGLTLSEWSKSAHQETIAQVKETNFMRSHLFGMQSFATKLSGIQDRVYATRDASGARVDLSFQEANFKAIFSDLSFEAKLDETFGTLGIETAEMSTSIDHLAEHLPYMGKEVVTAFRSAEADIRQQIEIMLVETNKTIAAMKNGDIFIASLSMNKTNEAFNKSIQTSLNASNRLDAILRQTVEKGNVVQARATWLHYLVGGCIALMILLACGYAHVVGKLLRKKYQELQNSNKIAEASNVEIQKVNDDITELNLELAANLKALKEAQDSLIKKGRMEQLGQLTATVAHELRNPLGAVRTSAYLMERKLGKNNPVEQQLTRISNGIMRCDNIITQLLDFSRTTKINCNTAVLDDWLESVLQEEAEKLPSAVTFTCNLQLDKTVVPFDPTRLQRAIINLLSNASEAMVGDGTDPAKFACAEPHIKVTSRIHDGDAIIEIADNGPGIPLELLEKVREPLFTTKSFGTGLGIPAIEQIAKQHGGSLDIQSSPGNGASFTLRLPLALKTSEAKAA